MRLLLTGAAGYTGTGIAEELAPNYDLRGLDIKTNEKMSDFVVADLADLDACRAALDGIDAVVMCHMAPNPVGYETPVLAMDVNVKGTANLYHAMAERDIKRCVLVSTMGVLFNGTPKAKAYPGDGPYNYNSRMYALTKILGECIARHYYENNDIITTLLRPGWIVYDGSVTTKYGQKLEQYNAGLIDPRDIGDAAHRSLQLKDATLEAFNIAQDDSDADLAPTQTRLGWHTRHKFESLTRPE